MTADTYRSTVLPVWRDLTLGQDHARANTCLRCGVLVLDTARHDDWHTRGDGFRVVEKPTHGLDEMGIGYE